MRIRSDEMKEILDRLRRIETRVTKFLIEQGFDTQSAKCEWDAGDGEDQGLVAVPSIKVALQEVYDLIPPDHFGEEVIVEHNGKPYCSIVRYE